MAVNAHVDLNGIGVTQSSVLRYLRRRSSASRVEIAELCGVTPAAISIMTRDLLKRGIIVEGERRKAARGAPHIDLKLNPSAGYALGVHCNRFSVTLTLLDFCGSVLGELHRPGRYDTFEDVREEIIKGKTKLLEKAGLESNALVGAGIAMPTRFSNAASSLDLAQEVVAWSGPDLAASLERGLGCAIRIENDANAAAMGELTLGNAAGYENFVYLYLSEGIGSGIIIGKQIYRGNLGNAGEIGALRARGLTRPSFEDLAEFCARSSEAPPFDRSPDDWSNYVESNPDIVQAWMNRAGPEAARLAFSLSSILAPEAVYVGGSLPYVIRDKLRCWFDFAVSDPFQGAKVLQPAILLPEVSASDAVAFGAAASVLHELP